MDDYGPSTYGDRIADVYDELYDEMFDTEGAVDFLAQLAGDGPVLELGIGTGRVALPLAARGIEVHGIDSSEAMVAKLRDKGGDKIPVTIGNFADVTVEPTYPLVFLVFNTLFALTEQDEQVRCFENVARCLGPGGAFVLEAFIPDVSRFYEHQFVGAERLEDNEVMLGLSRHDPVNQRVRSYHVALGPDGNRFYPVQIRYAYPSEMDLMARLAGLTLSERWGGWNREPFTSNSGAHISVYVKD